MSISSEAIHFFDSMNYPLSQLHVRIGHDDSNNFNITNTSGTKLSKYEISKAAKVIYNLEKKVIKSEKEFTDYIDKIKQHVHLGEDLSAVVESIQKIYHRHADQEIFSLGTDIKGATKRSFERSESFNFGPVKLARKDNLEPPATVRDSTPFPTTSLTRILTGDIQPEGLEGLGQMKRLGKTKKSGPLRPAERYKDVFVSSLAEYDKRGWHFAFPNKEHLVTNNDIDTLTKALDLKPSDAEKVKTNGAWMIQIHPGARLAIPTRRKSEFNPRFKEGGFTQTGQQEWVTPNVDIMKEAQAGTVRIYKIAPNGETVEWKPFKGKLYPFNEWQEVINEHAKNVTKKNDQSQ